MATWTDVSSTVLEPGDPIRSVDIIAIKENVIALSEGASGAPKILTAAINDAAVTSGKLATGTNERDWVLGRTAGASVGAVGTYAFLATTNTSNASADAFGATRAGSTLLPAGNVSQGENFSGNSLNGSASGSVSGTWRCMGFSQAQQNNDSPSERRPAGTLWLRIS
jgi:hypothetical protein